MKNGKVLSRAQKIMLSNAGKDPANYLVVKDLPYSMVILDRRTGKTEIFEKKERR